MLTAECHSHVNTAPGVLCNAYTVCNGTDGLHRVVAAPQNTHTPFVLYRCISSDTVQSTEGHWTQLRGSNIARSVRFSSKAHFGSAKWSYCQCMLYTTLQSCTRQQKEVTMTSIMFQTKWPPSVQRGTNAVNVLTGRDPKHFLMAESTRLSNTALLVPVWSPAVEDCHKGL